MAVPELRKITVESNPHVFIPKLQAICNAVGVAVVFVPAPPKCSVSGATWFPEANRAVIALSLRYKTDDHLWFSFFHEVGHLLKHSKKIRFIEGLEGLSPEQEQEADEFAQKTLIPHLTAYNRIGLCGCISKEEIFQFAVSEGISPGIVVGRLQHDGRLPYKNFNALKLRFQWATEQHTG